MLVNALPVSAQELPLPSLLSLFLQSSLHSPLPASEGPSPSPVCPALQPSLQPRKRQFYQRPQGPGPSVPRDYALGGLARLRPQHLKSNTTSQAAEAPLS